MRLGVFGGTFDPIHYGHLLLAECCREQCRLDRVLLLPAAVPPHKQGRTLSPADCRVAMLEAAIVGNGALAVSRHEVDRGGVNYTVDTLGHFRQLDPQAELFFLLGADMLADLPHWRDAARVCQLATLVVVGRPDSSPLELRHLEGLATPERIEVIRRHLVNMPRIGLSSSEIRRRVAADLSIRYWVPPPVEEYILQHGLYRDA
jgi:nicotinate-nucleotide adenylyltransferase